MDFDGDFLEKDIVSICYILSILYINHVTCNGQNTHFSLKKTELSISFLTNKMWPFRIKKTIPLSYCQNICLKKG